MKLQQKSDFLSTRVQYISTTRIRPNPQQPRRSFPEASVRCKVEHVFRIIKCLFGYRKVVYRGLRKNENRLYAMFACANLYMLARAGRKLAAS